MQEDRLKGFVIAGLAILILLIPFQIYFNFYKHLSVSVAQLLAGGIFLLWLFKIHKEGNYNLKRAPLNLPITFFILIMIASIFISTNKPTSLKYATKWISSIMIYFIVVNNIAGIKDIRRLMKMIFISGVILSLIGIVEYCLGREKMLAFVSTNKLVPLIIQQETLRIKLSTGSFNWLSSPIRAFGTFSCAISYSAYLGLILPILLTMALKKGRTQILFMIGTLLLVIAILLSFTRSAWPGMGVSFLLMFLLMSEKRHCFLKIGVPIMISLIILSLIFPLSRSQAKIRISQIFKSEPGGISERLSLWGTALSIIKARPILGVGVANYRDGRERFSKPEAPTLPAHSNYLQIGAEMGLLGLGAFIWIIIGGVVSSWRIFKRSKDEEIRLVGLGFLGLWTWFAIQSQFATYYESDKFGMLFWLMVGLNMALYRLSDRQKEGRGVGLLGNN